MKCEDCSYYWKDEYEDYPCCHFDPVHHPTPSPCEYDDYYREEDENDYESDIDHDYTDPCFGCMACDHSYNCKHCPHGDDGRYDSPFDVYTPAELGLNVKW